MHASSDIFGDWNSVPNTTEVFAIDIEIRDNWQIDAAALAHFSKGANQHDGLIWLWLNTYNKCQQKGSNGKVAQKVNWSSENVAFIQWPKSRQSTSKTFEKY